MNFLVKILVDHCGEKIENPKWCLIINKIGNQALCSGQFFGYGESRVVYKTKSVKRGGITCENCMKEIKEIKSVKL